jgi:predicted methyltransferase
MKSVLCQSLVISLLLSLPVYADHHGQADSVQTALQALADGEHRSAGHKARNTYRHPVETLVWFGLQPDMTVVEIWPGSAGWYLEILAPFLKDQGKYYAAGPDAGSSVDYIQRSIKTMNEKLAANAELYGAVMVTELAPPAGKTMIAPEGSADMVLTFRNVHNWMSGGYTADVFSAMYKALKPGGILGLTEHRGNPEVAQDPKAGSGYLNEDHTIELAQAAGFQLVERSEVNANPKDTKDYEGGVWTLPPVLRLKDVDRDTYLAIGESDRMTLKFVKPQAN